MTCSRESFRNQYTHGLTISSPNLYLWKSPYTPFLLSTWWNQQELLYDNHLCINGSKIEETGFRYNYPELRIEFLREVSAPTLHRTQVVSKLCLRWARLYVLVVDEPRGRVRIEGFSPTFVSVLLITGTWMKCRYWPALLINACKVEDIDPYFKWGRIQMSFQLLLK